MESENAVLEIMQNTFCAAESAATENVVYGNETGATTPPPKKRKKPSVTSTWTNSEINDLIQSVEEHPCIWEYSSADYKDRLKREQAWRKIAEKCPGHAVEECKAKWANIKTAFLNVKKKMTTKSGQGAENTQPHWPHWTAMQFYHSHDSAKSRSSVSTLEDDSPPTTSCISLSAKTRKLPEEKSGDADLMQRAVKYLETDEEDNWHAIGMYLASQLRQIAKTNKKAANKLHLQLVKTTMEAIVEAEDDD